MATGIDFAGVVEMVEGQNWGQAVIGGRKPRKWDKSKWRDAALFHQCLRNQRGETVNFSMFDSPRTKMDKDEKNAKRRIQYALRKKAT